MASASGQDATSLQTKVTDLEAEVERLRAQLGKAKGVNDVMWETVVQRVIGKGKDNQGPAVNGDSEGEEGARNRKRSRS